MATKRKKLVTINESVPREEQHTHPCSDCPFARSSIKGWLGGSTAEEYLVIGHSDEPIACHMHDNQQCAGAAMYRANVMKLPRNKEALRLPAECKSVFATPMEFLAHHGRESDG